MHGFILFALSLQVQTPAPTGYVNDFAGVILPEAQRLMLAVIDQVRARSGGEIVVVTLPDLGGQPAIEVARDLGRQWLVGRQGGAGDRARNAGVVLLLQPGERPGDGRAELAIATGSGAEGFITDAQAGRIRDAIGRVAVERGNYGDGLVAGVALLGQAYAREFGFTLSGETNLGVPRDTPSASPGLVGMLISLVVMFVLLTAIASTLAGNRRARHRFRRAGGLQWLLWSLLMSGRGQGHGSWGSWRGGGGFGRGGFGGFGGGGGFSGGGASGRF